MDDVFQEEVCVAGKVSLSVGAGKLLRCAASGYYYELSSGVVQNYALAACRYVRSAAHGHDEVPLRLDFLYDSRRGDHMDAFAFCRAPA